MPWLLVIHAVATCFMAGVIWIIQVVHYPLFGMVGRDGFAAYERSHASRITPVVGTAMLLEAACTGLLLLALGELASRGIPRWMPVVGAILLAGIWISTFALQVPLHGQLAQGFEDATHDALVRSNWIRTVGWTLRGALAAWMLVLWMQAPAVRS
jgi:uncharacterized membrane protein